MPQTAGAGGNAKVSGGSNNSILHQQSMEWLRVPRGYYGVSDGPLEGLKRLRRELMVEYQQLGGDATSLLDQQAKDKDQAAQRMPQYNAFSGGRRPPPNLHQNAMGYKPDQLDRWISHFQHKRHLNRGNGGGGGGYGGGNGGGRGYYGGPQRRSPGQGSGQFQNTQKGGRFGAQSGRMDQGFGAGMMSTPSLKADSELIYM